MAIIKKTKTTNAGEDEGRGGKPHTLLVGM
jgi:hypothetical protein